MEWWEAFWLGLMQGITEFINFGTLLALVIYYRKRIWQILKDVFVKHNLELATNIVYSGCHIGRFVEWPNSILSKTEIIKIGADIKKNPREIGSFSHAILYQKWRLNLVRETGLEPARRTAYAPKAYVYTNFTTRAWWLKVL